MNEITAPYNFVPLSDKVYFPNWAEKVSHDIPFQDGISGTIECTLTAHSPIYVRNGGNWTDDDKKSNPDYFSFFKVGNNEYLIPGTSIKGMIRNVLEIISFGKMGTKVDNNRYAIRDLYNSDYQREMTEGSRGAGFSPIPKAGWLSQKNGEWIITPCEFARVEQDELTKYHGSFPDLKTKQSAESKYNKWAPKLLEVKFDVEEDNSRNIIYKHTHSCGTLIYKKAINLDKGKLNGKIVFTGQSMNNDGRPGRKHLEFIFYNSMSVLNKKVDDKVDDKLMEDFKFIHSKDYNTAIPNDEWKHWKSKKEIPVFYLERSGKITSMGLALMYRLAYSNSTHDAIANHSYDHLSEKYDMSDVIFGCINGKNNNALKGRVSICHAKVVSEAKVDNEIRTILGSPKPTYYPIYLEQNTDNNGQINGKYQTFMNGNCKIKGLKRYPVREKISELTKYNPKNDSGTCFTPLKDGVKFNFPIRIHNVRPVELGALIWALTWGGDNNLYHSIGMGKPFGFGKVQIKINNATLRKNSDIIAKKEQCPFNPYDESKLKVFMNEFIKEIGGNLNIDWEASEQIKYLKAMANPENAKRNNLQYMALDPDKRINEFADGKKGKNILQPYKF